MSGQKCTMQVLKNLRQLMQDVKYVKEPLQAYIVPWADAHNSEYLADCDKQRAFVSGFTGSAGTVVITEKDACLWTDGRYYLQASQELDSNWTLMKESLPNTPSKGTWLTKALPSGSRVGADPLVMTHSTWKPLHDQLNSAGHSLVPVDVNLVNVLWDKRPERPCNSVRLLPLRYTGKSTVDKLIDIRAAMEEQGAGALVVTALDEIAWVLNMRGTDIEYNPVFFAYVVITKEQTHLFMDEAKLTPEVREYLNDLVVLHPYDDIKPSLSSLIPSVEGKIWLSSSANQALASLVPERRLLVQVTPIALMKAIKNSTEIEGMRKAHIRDAAALCCYFSWLERELISGAHLTELSVAAKLEQFRSQQEDYMGPSFTTISSVGPHGAIIHYQPDKKTDAIVTRDQLYLCDSGGQYLDGTTDVTRTLHFGIPNDYERECFTRVLKGQMLMGCAIFPEKIKGNCLDSFARRFLWDVGLDYQHGTGHGIGSFLNVHEGPMGISWRTYPEDPGLQCGMFLSNEPGFYEDGKFGIRLENIVQVIEAKTPHKFGGRKFLTFDTITLVPIQCKMICREMLTPEEMIALNAYHQQCREIVGPLLLAQRQTEALQWLERETKPI